MRALPAALLLACAQKPPAAAPPAAPIPAVAAETVPASAKAPAAAPAHPGALEPTETARVIDGLDGQAAIKDRMKKIKAATGISCDGCHDVADFQAPTAKKGVATLMWNRMVVNLKTKDGGDVFCDTCHAGHDKFLDRSDPDKLKEWMKANFVDKLVQKDGSPVKCDTCHHGARWKFLPETI